MTEDLTLYAAAGFHENILNTLYDLQQSQHCCDLTLKAKDGQIKVHSLIMLASSSFFYQWYNNQKDKSSLNFWVPELSLSDLKIVIEYFYTGKLVITQQSVCPYATLFERLWVEEAVSLCHQFVMSRRSADDSSNPEIKHSETMKLVSMQVEPGSDDSASSGGAGGEAGSPTSFKDNSHKDGNRYAKSSKNTQGTDRSSLTSSDLSKSVENTAMLHSTALVKIEKVDTETVSQEVESGRRRKALKRKRDYPVKIAVPKIKRKPVSTSQKKSKRKVLTAREKTKIKRRKKIQQESDVKHEDEEGEEEELRGEELDKVETIGKQERKSDSELESDDADEMVHSLIKKTTKKLLAKPQKARKKPYRYRCKKRIYPCEFCGYVAREKIGLAGHQKSKHQVPFDANRFTVLRCKDCSFETLVMKRLEKHMAKHTEERPNICEHCGKTFKLQGELNAHVKIHLDPTKFQCSQCNRTFSSPYTLKDHVDNIHLGLKNKQYLCHLCSHTTCDTVKLNQHLYNAHNIMPSSNITTFKCEDCDFIAFRRFAFINHRKLHEGQRDFHCGVCGKGYITARALRHHMIWHSEKKFVCEFEACRYASPSKRQLDQHVRLMHTERDVKPFACHLCPHRTGVRGNLDKHLRTVHSLDIPDKRKYSHLYMLGRSPKNKSELSGKPSAQSENNTSYETINPAVGVSSAGLDCTMSSSDVKTASAPAPPAIHEMPYDTAALAQYMSYLQNME